MRWWAVFDLDGVVTRTDRLHAEAWQRTFDAFLRKRAGGAPFRPFDPERDYRAHVDGKPREAGVRDFLASRGILADPETVASIATRKNELFRTLLEESGAEVIPGAVELLQALRRRGIPAAVASSSRNCAAVLAASGLEDLFDARVDGVTLERRRLAGKPAPDLFLEAARELGADLAASVLFEDAVAGVQAGRAAGFGLVVGVDQGGNRDALLRAGADLVVRDPGELTVEYIEGHLAGGTELSPP